MTYSVTVRGIGAVVVVVLVVLLELRCPGARGFVRFSRFVRTTSSGWIVSHLNGSEFLFIALNFALIELINL